MYNVIIPPIVLAKHGRRTPVLLLVHVLQAYIMALDHLGRGLDVDNQLRRGALRLAWLRNLRVQHGDAVALVDGLLLLAVLFHLHRASDPLADDAQRPRQVGPPWPDARRCRHPLSVIESAINRLGTRV